MVHDVLPLDDRILVIAERRQPGDDEMVERGQRLRTRDPERERLEIAEMLAEARRDQCKHFLRYRIGRERCWPGIVEPAWRPLAVLGIEIPAVALGLAELHQQPGLLAHQPVEILHHQTLAPARPVAEIGAAAQEAIVGHDLDRHTERLVPAGDHRVHTPLAGLDDADFGGAVTRHRTRDLAVEAAGVARVVEPDIVDRPAIGPPFVGEVAHGGKQQRDLDLVVSHIGGLRHYLDHQQHRVRAVDAAQAGERRRQLVAQHRDQNRHARINARGGGASKRGDVAAVAG